MLATSETCLKPGARVWPKGVLKTYYCPPREGSGRWYKLQCFLRICHNFALEELVPVGCLLLVVSVLQIDGRRLVVGVNCKLT